MTASTPASVLATALGDDALVLSHRLGEWAGHAPVLEEEVALANIALDLLGQARVLLSLVGDEDELAYLRTERAFRNCQLVEQPNGDFAHTIARQLYFSTYQHLLYERLAAADAAGGTGGAGGESTRGTAPGALDVPGPVVELAAKAVKEVAYHRDHARQWTLRLGDGTQESHQRMQRACTNLWRYTGELFQPWNGLHANDTAHPADAAETTETTETTDTTNTRDTRGARGTAAIARSEAEADWWGALESEWTASVTEVLHTATLTVPEGPRTGAWSAGAGRQGLHTEPFGRMLAEMQHLHRSHPGATW